MKEHEVDCPKCKGSGKVIRKYIILSDKDKKYCPSCEKILDRKDFYSKGKNATDSYCKKCKNKKTVGHTQCRVKKYTLTCEVCGNKFLCRRKTQISCSQICHSKRMTYYRHKKLLNSMLINTDVD